MPEFYLPALPTLAELATARYWTLGGGLAGASGGALYWLGRRAAIFGKVEEPVGPPPEVPGLPSPEAASFWKPVIHYAALGAVAATFFAVATSRDMSEFASLSVVLALISLMAAVWTLIHRPAHLVPVGEAPPEPNSDEEGWVKKGTWRALVFAALGLAFAASEFWLFA